MLTWAGLAKAIVSGKSWQFVCNRAVLAMLIKQPVAAMRTGEEYTCGPPAGVGAGQDRWMGLDARWGERGGPAVGADWAHEILSVAAG